MVKRRVSHPGAGSYGSPRIEFHTPSTPKQKRKARHFDELVAILLAMEPREIGAALAKVDYYTMPGYKAEKAAREQAIARAAEQYIQTPHAQRIIMEKAREAARTAVSRYARHVASELAGSEEFQKQVHEILASIGLKNIEPEQDDSFSAACRRAAQKRVDQWLDSQRGQQTIAAIREKAVAEAVLDSPPGVRRSWIRSALEGLDHGASA